MAILYYAARAMRELSLLDIWRSEGSAATPGESSLIPLYG